jgi:hypothetical protein
MLPGDFCTSITLDNGILRQSVASGEEVPASEALSLAAGVEAVFLTAVLESRRLDWIRDRRKLWGEVAGLLDQLCCLWSGIDSDDSQIQWLCARLERLRGLSNEQVALYSVTTSERLRHAADRGTSIEKSSRVEPNGYSNDQSSPAHVYRCQLPQGTLAAGI